MATRDFAKVVRGELSRDKALHRDVDKERFNADVAHQIIDARKLAGLTQQQLAERAGTHQSVIARLEDADYSGHSLRMLWNIAWALDSRLTIGFEPRAGAEPDDGVATFTLSDVWVVDGSAWNPISVRDTATVTSQGAA